MCGKEESVSSDTMSRAQRLHALNQLRGIATAAMQLMEELWDEDSLVDYPIGLPSFDEFTAAFSGMYWEE